MRPIVLNSARVVEAEVHALGWTHRRSVDPAHRAGREAFRTLHARELADLADVADTCSDQDFQTAAQVLRALDHDIRDRATGTKRPTQERR